MILLWILVMLLNLNIPEQAEDVENMIENFVENVKEHEKLEKETKKYFKEEEQEQEEQEEQDWSNIWEEPTQWTPVQGSSDQVEEFKNSEMPSSTQDEGLVEVTPTQDEKVTVISPLSEDEKDALDEKYESFTDTPKQFIEGVKQVHFKSNMKVEDLILGSIGIKSRKFSYEEDWQLKKLNGHFQVIKENVFENKPKEFKLFCEEFVKIDKKNKMEGSGKCRNGHNSNNNKYCCISGCISMIKRKAGGNPGPFTRFPTPRKSASGTPEEPKKKKMKKE
jgi:hypothetical protein